MYGESLSSETVATSLIPLKQKMDFNKKCLSVGEL